MNRKLLIVLALVGGLSLYLSSQGDDELLAAGKQGQGAARGPGQRGNAPRDEAQRGGSAKGGSRAAAREAKVAPVEPWVAQALTQGVAQWRARTRADGRGPGDGASDALGSPRSMAWASMSPPPPPPVRLAAAEPPPPPPPPMAPRFPHAWVGRFNDEPVAAAASQASAPGQAGVARAVLVSAQSTWVVRAGDVIEGQWRVDRIQDRTMSLTYLPLKQQQTVAMR